MQYQKPQTPSPHIDAILKAAHAYIAPSIPEHYHLIAHPNASDCMGPAYYVTLLHARTHIACQQLDPESFRPLYGRTAMAQAWIDDDQFRTMNMFNHGLRIPIADPDALNTLKEHFLQIIRAEPIRYYTTDSIAPEDLPNEPNTNSN